MPDAPKTFYLTTPIYYVNARPHIGHAYSTIVADVLARRHRLLGDDTYFLTGTDEHGQKIERAAAAAAGIPPQQYADQVSKTFSDLWARMGITHDQFIRTTDPKHIAGAQKLFADLHARGQIYLSSYTGQYSVGEEMFVEGPPGTIGPDGRPTETVTEENFFFRLSDFQLPLLNLIESNELLITPDSSRNEVLAFLRGNISSPAALSCRPERSAVERPADGAATSPGAPFMAPLSGDMGGVHTADPAPASPTEGASAPGLATSALGHPYVPGALRDLSVSRSSFTWGIPVPEPAASETKQKHVIYVWLDALANYMTALGYGSLKPDGTPDDALWQKFWPADIHLVGKEITRFHCVYWPAFLLALNPKLQHKPDEPTPILSPEEHKVWAEKWLPKQVTANGWLLFDNSKMSKSKGNVVRTETILNAFGPLCPPPSEELVDTNELVILSETKDLLSSDSPTLPAESTNRRGTASAVPLSSLKQGALAPEVRLVSPLPAKNLVPQGFSLGSHISEKGEGVLTPGGEPTPHDRDLFAADILRYYLLREIPFGQDGSFSFDSLITRYNADLANGYGNLVKRTLTLVHENLRGFVPGHTDWGTVVIQVLKRKLTSGHAGRPTDFGPFIETADVDLARIATTLIELHERAFAALRFSLGMDFDPLTSAIRAPSVSGAVQVEGWDYGVLDYVALLIGLTDELLTLKKPWKLAKLSDDASQREVGEVLYIAAESIRIITALLYPILPYATARVWAQLGLGDIEAAARNGELRNLQWGGLKPGTKLGPLSPIFPRAPKELAQIMNDMENPPAPEPTSTTDPAAGPRTASLPEPTGTLPVAGSAAHTTHSGPTPSHTEAQPSGIFANAPSTPPTLNPEPSSITIDDFAKIELRVAQILLAERIPKADKLLRLEVDLGPEGKRQILSGIAEWYTPEDLLHRKIVVITNLAPRKMRGLESHGMLLAASEEGGKPVLATFAEDIPNGTRLK